MSTPERAALADAVTFLAGAFGADRLTPLLEWADRQQMEPLVESIGEVSQRALMAVIAPPGEAWDELTPTLGALTAAVDDQRWRPNEAAIMRYEGEGAGITPHRDNRRFIHAVAIVSLVGEASLDVFDQSRTLRIAHRRCLPGDLVILRGPDPGANGAIDVRPVHALSDPSPGRISLTLRMDSGTARDRCSEEGAA